MSLTAVALLLPEMVVALVGVWTYVASAFTPARSLWSWFAGGGLLVAAWHLSAQGDVLLTGSVLEGPLAMDAFSYSLRWGALALGLLFVLILARPASAGQSGEVLGSLLMIVAGLMIVASANELVLLFVGLELISIPTYVLLSLGRRTASSGEAVAKYFFLSILSSALLLYGFSMLYGAAGTTHLAGIHDQLLAAAPTASSGGAAGSAAGSAAGPLALARIAAVMVLAGVAFRLTAVPFHFYAPDVFQGTTSANAALLAVAPKFAGVIVLVRVFLLSLPGLEEIVWQLTVALALLTMTLGNLLALWQHNVRRLLAYSSVAHAGYMLIGLAVALAPTAATSGGVEPTAALLLYLAVYSIASIGALAALAYLSRGGHQIDSIHELTGLGRSRPLVAVLIALAMFSLAGIPPMAGFFGKLALFSSAVQAALGGEAWMRPWFWTLAVAGVLNAVIALAYYLRVVGVMYFRPPLAVPRAEGGLGAYAAAVVCGALVLASGPPLVSLAADAARPVASTRRPLGSAVRAAADAAPVADAARPVAHAAP